MNKVDVLLIGAIAAGGLNLITGILTGECLNKALKFQKLSQIMLDELAAHLLDETGEQLESN